MQIYQTLKKLGFSEKEIEIYILLLKNGRIRPSKLAKLAGINRTTLYNSVKGLLSKGVIAEDHTEKILNLVPLHPNSFENILEQSRRELAEKEVLVNEAVKELNMIDAEKSYPIPKFQFVTDENLEKFLYDNIVKWQREVLRSGGIWWGFQDHSFVEIFENWINYTWQTAMSRDTNYKVQILSNDSQIEGKMKRLYPKTIRDIQFAHGMNFTSTIWVCGDYMVIVVTNQKPFYLFEINDKTLAHNMREMLKKLWTISNL